MRGKHTDTVGYHLSVHQQHLELSQRLMDLYQTGYLLPAQSKVVLLELLQD